jgi:hypothetical protein
MPVRLAREEVAFCQREIDLDFPVSLCRVKVSIDAVMIGDAWRSCLPSWSGSERLVWRARQPREYL